ncbi:acyltransferase [Pelosinus sp. sgz500959]|uniref:acyltransferase n=1 Tax=Pelosinus sp. sgz500959 TaxID=3242472 RepID=UPI00367008E1
MSKQRINALEYIRGISMLGVVGIHTGAYSLSNPKVNVHLFALLEILTRFSVPIFFFVSAFGLFVNQDLTGKLNYMNFIMRRWRTVLLPYIVWSLLYMLHYTFMNRDFSIWTPPLVYEFFLFGLASCQLYFLVILLWFYSLMPLWRSMVRYIIDHPLRNLSILLLLQIIFNYYSSYLLKADFTSYYFNKFISYRLNYWVFHYIFIFLFGAVCAVNYSVFEEKIKKYQQHIKSFFYLTTAGMLSFYYYLLYVSHYSPEQAVNTAHQLSPIGVLYTLGSTLFLFLFFNNSKLPNSIESILSALGKHSYLVYLVHPLVMYYLDAYLTRHNIMMSAIVVIIFYLLTIGISLTFAVLIKHISKVFPIVSVLLTGSSLPKQKSGV